MRAETPRTTRRALHPGRIPEAGFTLVEMTVSMVIATVILLGVYEVMTSQSRLYRTQSEMTEVHRTLRAGGHLLAWELRQVSPSGGDIVEATDSSVVLRSTRTSGIVCNKNLSTVRYGLYRLVGDNPAVGDSLLIFVPNGMGTDDDEWELFRVDAAATPGDWSMGDCDYYPSAPAPDHGIELDLTDADTTGIVVGSPFRIFDRVEYGAFTADDGRWLGRRVAGGTWEKLAGPLEPDGGLKFRWYDASGAVTTTEADITDVEFLLRADPTHGADDASRRDYVTMRVRIRG